MRAFLLLALIGLMGCGVKAPLEGRADPFVPGQVHFANKDLKNRTAVGTPRAVRDEAGRMLYVTVPIRAASNLKLYIDYRVTFFDPGGQVLSQTGWMNRTLEPNVPDQITVNSMSPEAADFQVDFRYAQ